MDHGSGVERTHVANAEPEVQRAGQRLVWADEVPEVGGEHPVAVGADCDAAVVLARDGRSLHLEEQPGVLGDVPVDVDLGLDLESLVEPEE